MGFLSRWFGKPASAAYYTWHTGSAPGTCDRCRERDGTCWIPDADFKAPPLRSGCGCPGGCTCRALPVRVDEAWGPGNAAWIGKRGGVVSGAQMDKFLSS